MARKQSIKSFSTERTVVIPDIHFEHPVRNGDGKLIKAERSHNPEALSVLFQVLNDWGADRIIQIGDLWELEQFSRWTASFNRDGQVQGEDGSYYYSKFESNINLGKDFWKYLINKFPKAERVQIEGNHEYRLKLALKKPQFAYFTELLDIKNWEFWKQNKIQYIPYYDFNKESWYDVGKIRVLHGAKTNAETVRKEHDNCVFGHTHRIENRTWVKSSREVRTAYNIGCLCNTKAEFVSKGGTPSGWENAFCYIFTLPNGNFDVRTVRIVDGNCVVDFNGKTYWAKPLDKISKELKSLNLPS